MFKKAKVKLTIWYLAIIMAVTITFSLIIYSNVNTITQRILSNQQSRIERHYSNMRPSRGIPPAINEEAVKEYRAQVLNLLIRINLGVLTISGVMGYFLAGRNLKPIEEMVKEQRRFVSDAAHELKTPLTSLKTEMEVAVRDKHLNTNDARKVVESNLEEINKVITLTNNLLAESRYDSDNEQIELKETDLSKVISGAISRHEKKAKLKNIEIKSDIIPQIVMGNEEMLTDLASVLIDNAIKYSAKNKTVKIKLFDRDNHPVFVVEDEGKGIKNENLPYIFNRFYRADASRSKQNEEGFGLGLSIAANIAKKHKAKIDIKSEYGMGSIFTVVFPKDRKRA